MILAYGGAALTMVVAQQSGADMLRAALDGDPETTAQILHEAQTVVGSGLDLGQAAIIIALVPLAHKLLQMATPWSDAGAAWWRKKLLGEIDRHDAQ